MNDDRLDDMLRECFKPKFAMDNRVKAQTKRKMYEKQERHNNFLLCLIQIAMFVMTISIVTTVFIINQGMAVALLIAYTVIGSFISAIIILLSFQNNKIAGRINSYD